MPSKRKVKMQTTLKAACNLIPLLLTGVAFAQNADNYPSRPVTIIAPLAPGAATEAEGRVYANRLSEVLGQQFLMDFKPGGATTVGLAYTARQKPDGYTLAYVNATYSLLPLLFKDLTFDPLKSFEQISLLSKRGAFIVVANTLPVRNIQEYTAYAKANPGKINFGTSGNGSTLHLMGLWLASATNTQLNFIPYKASGAAYPDLMAGRVHMMPVSVSSGYSSMVKPGKIRVIGVANLQRSALMPDMPTVSEQGIPDYEYPSWLGILAPAKTPPAVLTKLHGEIVKMMKVPEIQQKLGEDTQLVGSTPEQFHRLVTTETERWRKLVQDNNIKFDDVN